MKTYRPQRRRKAHHPRVPAFLPVPQRARRDGWTPARQARFLAHLAITRSVVAAARKVGMARETAYRLRAKPGAESFAAAWDRVVGRTGHVRKVTADEQMRRALGHRIQPRIFRGQCIGIVPRPDSAALRSLIAAFYRSAGPSRVRRERSHSFAPVCAEQALPPDPALPRRSARPISLARRACFAPQRQGSR